ncbi:MAG: hypothetical protein AB1540_07560 [Bdellovibrionota bacterium]
MTLMKTEHRYLTAGTAKRFLGAALSLTSLFQSPFGWTSENRTEWLRKELAAPGSATKDEGAHLKRGKEVEDLYLSYAKRLAQVYDALRAALKQDAPEILKRMTVPPPKPVEIGYQVLPRLFVDHEAKQIKETRPISTSYSWARTEQFIRWELTKIDEAQEKLGVLAKLSSPDRKAILGKTAAEFAILRANQNTIDHHLQYNRFWQQAIAQDRARFDRLTFLHDLVVERQKLRDIPSPTDQQVQQEKKYAEQLDKETEELELPGFVQVRHPKPNVWIVQVPVYTDISNKAFTTKLKTAIEKEWYVESRENVYKLEIKLTPVSPQKLYAPSKPPRPGEKMDLSKHIARFPKNGGVITTGSNSTFASPGRYIALGPQDLSHNVAAHEFGHILGFADWYFRGYRDKGSEGFEVLEIVPDLTDLMCSPGNGKAKRHHYERILKKFAQRSQAPSQSSR